MSTAPPGPFRVLLIDDRRDAVVPVQRMLQLDKHEVAVAADGPAGLAKAAEFAPQIVLCDIGLAGAMDGYDVGRALRAKPETADAYMVAVTGYGGDDDRARARAAGFDFHLTKPIGREQLQKLIAERPRFAG